MSRFIPLILHLLAAIMFVGVVFFEVLILEGIRKPVGRETMRTVEVAIGRRAHALDQDRAGAERAGALHLRPSHCSAPAC